MQYFLLFHDLELNFFGQLNARYYCFDEKEIYNLHQCKKAQICVHTNQLTLVHLCIDSRSLSQRCCDCVFFFGTHQYSLKLFIVKLSMTSGKHQTHIHSLRLIVWRLYLF